MLPRENLEKDRQKGKMNPYVLEQLEMERQESESEEEDEDTPVPSAKPGGEGFWEEDADPEGQQESEEAEGDEDGDAKMPQVKEPKKLPKQGTPQALGAQHAPAPSSAQQGKEAREAKKRWTKQQQKTPSVVPTSMRGDDEESEAEAREMRPRIAKLAQLLSTDAEEGEGRSMPLSSTPGKLEQQRRKNVLAAVDAEAKRIVGDAAERQGASLGGQARSEVLPKMQDKDGTIENSFREKTKTFYHPDRVFGCGKRKASKNTKRWRKELRRCVELGLRTTNEDAAIKYIGSEPNVLVDLSLMELLLAAGWLCPGYQFTIGEWRSLVSGHQGKAESASTLKPPSWARTNGILPLTLLTDNGAILHSATRGIFTLYGVLRDKLKMPQAQVLSGKGARIRDFNEWLECLMDRKGIWARTVCGETSG